MPELPIVAEASNWGAFIIGAVLVVCAVAVVVGAWRIDWPRRLVGLAFALIPLSLALILTVRDIGWQLRIDQKGIALHAPLEPFWATGEIAWPDLTAVEIVRYANRGSHHVLHIRGRRGVELWIAGPGQMPPQFITQLQAVVARLAPQVTGIAQLERQFRYAREQSTSFVYNSYSVRDGRGVLLQ